MPEQVRRGRSATAEEDLALEVAETALSYEKSLTRVEATARLTFGAVAGAAAALSALGLSSDARQQLLAGPSVLGLPAAASLLVLSLLLAGVALVPSLRRVNMSSPSDVRGFFERSILRRGACTLASLGFLGLAVLLAFIALLRAADESPQLTVTSTRQGDRLLVEASAAASGRDDQAQMTLVVRENGSSRVRCRSEQVDGPAPGAALRCRTSVSARRGGTVVARAQSRSGDAKRSSVTVVSK